MKRQHRLRLINVILHLTLTLGLIGVPLPGWGQDQVDINEQQNEPQEICSTTSALKSPFKLDGADLVVCTQFLPGEEFIAAEPDSLIQSATMVDSSALYRNFAITAIPYGTSSPTENLPVAQPGSGAEYRIQLRQFRQSQGGNPQAGLPITIFDQVVDASLSIVNLAIRPDRVTPVVIAEWVAEAGSRIWLIRLSEELGEVSAANIKIDQWATLLNQTSIRATNLNAPSTLLATQAQLQSSSIDQGSEESQPSDLPTPSWWKGECNKDNHAGSFPLGGSYQGVKACGPKNSYVIVDFGVGVKQKEWQCTEYSKRFMLLAYSVAPYIADGKDVVNNFPSSKYPDLKVEKVANGTVGKAPRPGDILSYGINTTSGHTSVVSESNVDSNGNGSVNVIEQNLSLNGIANLTVKNWRVNRDVDSWLRFNSDGGSSPTPPRSCPGPNLKEPSHGSVFDNRTIAFRWSGPDCLHDGYTFRIKTVSDMDSGGETVIDTGEGNTERTVTIDEKWENRDLYWSVKAANAPGGATWAPVRQFRVSTNKLPVISFTTANTNASDTINSRDQNWTFTGTASDPEGKLSRVEFKCEGDSCNAQESLGANGNWSYTRNGLSGENRIRFRACDEKQCSDYSRTVTLRIDLAAPTTKADLSGQKAGDWFNSAVTVKFHADDGATGNARVGVDKIFYRLDGGGWQSGGGQDVSFAVNQDGAHTVEYYAVDGLDNQEATKSISFKLDATPPSPPSNASELNGVVNGQWQKAVGASPAPVPVFQWQPGSDATSGLFQHELYFGDKADGADPQKFVLPTEAATWTPLPAGVRTGTWYLRARTRDKANNVSDWVTLFTFRYDNTPPANPATATHDANIANNTWQRTASVPNFTWTPASDEGSGIQGYRLYWGSDSNGQANNLSNVTSYQSATPLCAANQACIGYLRILSVDNVNNEAAAWGTLFTLKYDGLPPTLDLKVNNGVTYTAQTLVTLNLNGVDEHSGLREMRFSHDGVVWTPWEAYATEKIWQIPAIGRQSWPVYAQVRDAVGNESAVSHQDVYFEVNRQQPQSASYRLFDSLNSAGVGSHNSTSYQGASTVGQVVDAARTSSDNYRITGGYQAGSQAIPLVIPGHDEFTFINGVFASGVVVNTMQSASYAMLATVGEVGLPNNTTTLNSASYQHQPGFLAAVPAATHVVPTPVPTPGPTPLPEPTPDCEFAVASVNNGALFTNSPAVTLNLCAPRVQQMIVSNDGGFGGAQWETYARQKPWTVTTYGQQVLPRQVYVKYRDEKNVIQTASDDIIYDPTAPSGQLLVNSPISPQVVAAANQVQAADVDSSFNVAGITYLRQVNGMALAQPLPLVAPKQSQSSSGTVDLYLIAQDDNSGMAQMQLSENADFTGSSWRAYAGLVEYNPSGDDGVKTLYARFQDSAGNVSVATEAGFVLDSQPPLGGMSVVEQIVGPHALTITLYLQAEDNLSGVDAMRISARESFTDAVWQPIVSNLVWPIYLAEGQSSGSLFIQFRDKTGNISQSYQTDYLVDAQPPIIYAETISSTNLTRALNLYAYDELSALRDLYLTNDPLFSEGVTRQPYTDTVSWTFDERHVVWIKVADSVGNVSDAYPLYAAGIDGTPPLPTESKLYLPLVNR